MPGRGKQQNYGKCGFDFGKPKMQHTAPLEADQRLESPWKIQTSTPPHTLMHYLSVMHGCSDHRPVLLALVTIVFTVKPGDKLTLCYQALKT